ncbi:MAG TPA: PEP-CTERM sorting domain-containing protein, partial [Lacipirellulaceae bacterium]
SQSSLAADGNGDGIIDAGDYIVWRDHLGASVGSGAGASSSAVSAVPEPSTLLLGLMAAAGVWSAACRLARPGTRLRAHLSRRPNLTIATGRR